jgi:ribosomal protein L22
MAPTQGHCDLSFEEVDALIREDHRRDIARRVQCPPVIAPQGTAHASMVPSRCTFVRSLSDDAAEITDVSAESTPGMDIEVLLQEDSGAFISTDEEPLPIGNEFGTTFQPLSVVPSDNGMDMEVFFWNEDFDASSSNNVSLGTTEHPSLDTTDCGSDTEILRALSEDVYDAFLSLSKDFDDAFLSWSEDFDDAFLSWSEDFDDVFMSFESFWIHEVHGDVWPLFDDFDSTTDVASVSSDEDVDSSSSSEQASSKDVLLIYRDVLEQFRRDYLSTGKSEYAASSIDVKNKLGYEDRDILFGRGGKMNQHAGNQTLRERAKKLRIVYWSTRGKKVKQIVSQMLVDSFNLEGARFLKKCRTTGKWTVVSNKEARTKAGQVLCQPYDPEKAAIKRTKYPKKSAKKKASTKK